MADPVRFVGLRVDGPDTATAIGEAVAALELPESLPAERVPGVLYNNEGELASWQNASSSPSATAQFLYEGQGHRVAQVVTQSAPTTTTIYVGNMEEVTTSGSTTTTTKYYYAAGQRIGLSVNGVIDYLASDALGSPTVALNSSGSATASELYAPYGG
ncbi:MAG TPA: hypothetical protein VLW53_22870 [Candidatus Eisenbacteria bacterium]|nr:hypothetical protein [Candidatus Eisenbacteria bacterium]